MSIAFATKSTAGNKRVLRPAVDIDVASINPTWFDEDARYYSPSSRKIVRTNLDASVVAVEASYGKREYQLAVRVIDDLPVVLDRQGDDRFVYYRRHCAPGVYLLLNRTVYDVASAEALIVAWESLTTSADRLTLRIPAKYQPAVENAVRLLGVENDYTAQRRGLESINDVARALDALSVAGLLREAIKGGEDTELSLEFVGTAPDAQAIRNAAHGEAIEYVIAARAQAAQDRYKIQQDLPVLRAALDEALAADAATAQALADALTSLRTATDEDTLSRFEYGTEGSLYYSRVDTDRSKQAAQRLQQALQGLRWIEQDAERQTVLAGEDY